MSASRRRPNLLATPSQPTDSDAFATPFYKQVFATVASIPRGRVTTYGSIARALGRPRGARSVGWALHIAPEAADLPCHRVVNHIGYLSGGWHWGHPDVMAELLRAEGVPFRREHHVDLKACLWLPEQEV